MKNLLNVLLLALVLPINVIAEEHVSGPSTREMERINWMEFQEWIPNKINTVLLPTGTLEAHGVANNGADNTAPFAISNTIAQRINSMVAPTLAYGMTGSLAAYPGAFQMSAEVYKPFVKEILQGLVKNKFKTIIIINGHGGGQTAVLKEVAAEIANEYGVRTLVINWWSFAADITQEVFGENGGHAGWNENAFIQAIDPSLIQQERYSDDLATASAQNGSWSATPFPSSIILYQEGEGYIKFDQQKADEYFKKVTDKMASFIIEIKTKWDKAGL
ncbi:creatininase family protein [Paraglaciecola sp. 25GB23A]|uniref:creatininase family protein n=1 Tax=Paraglaciecola sp. 25GB23A TaxID=3156068 RepID=UPI0032AEB0AF